MEIDWSVILSGTIPAIVLAVVGYLLGKREREKKIESSTVEDAKTVTDMQERALKNLDQYWTQRLEDLVRDKEVMRQKIGELMVENVELKEKNAEKQGYINGITDPLVKLEEEQKAALRGGRRSTDVK
jgi:predicted nuclease with TOPRIM domain